MPTAKQVEEVAREIFQHDHLRTDMRPWSSLDDGERRPYIRQAQAAVSAYERARPVVTNIRELVQVFLDAKEARFRQGHSSSYDDNEAGVQAVRDAVLEEAATEAERLAEYYNVHRYDDPDTKWREAFNLETMYLHAAPWLRSLKGSSDV